MSSLAAARADNFYIDPARFDPSVKSRSSVNALANSHPLGVRAKRLYTEGILVIRFEMPYDSWCLKCDNHIAQGVRFNADKQADGTYFSTKIWRFSFKCPRCDNPLVMRTDPARGEYEYVAGFRRKVKSFDPGSAGIVTGASEGQKAALQDNALYKIEHATDDQRRARSDHARLAALAEIQADRYADPYASNGQLRAAAREVRRSAHVALLEGAALGLPLPLLPGTEEDAEMARTVMAARDVERAHSGAASAGAASRVAQGGARRRALPSSAAPPPPSAALFAPLYGQGARGRGGGDAGAPSAVSAASSGQKRDRDGGSALAAQAAPLALAARPYAACPASDAAAPPRASSSVSWGAPAAATAIGSAQARVNPALLKPASDWGAPPARGGAAAGRAPPPGRGAASGTDLLLAGLPGGRPAAPRSARPILRLRTAPEALAGVGLREAPR